MDMIIKYICRFHIPLCLAIVVSCTNEEFDNCDIILGKPKNVILMIGDGMGLAQVSSIDFLDYSENNFRRFPAIGLINTGSASHKITDSAASATAFASGEKTYNGAIGVDPDTNKVQNIIEIISEDVSSGIVVTSSITHATPAAFYAHVASRNMHEEIAKQLSYSTVDFFAGGGRKYFTSRSDNLNLLDMLESKGFMVELSDFDLSNPPIELSKKYGFLLADDGLPAVNNGRGYFLSNATKLAIDYLSQNPEGFFLMVEGSQIDWGGHQNDSSYVVSEMLDFNHAIGVALDFAESVDNTMVIVTADHETGGMSLNSTGIQFSTTGHTSTQVPVFAYGPGSKDFIGVYENTEIFNKILQMHNRY